MYQLTNEEVGNLMFQIGTSSWGGIRKPAYVFTEQRVAMLSSVLRSKRAIRVNIQIMRAFVTLKELFLTHKDLAENIRSLKKKYASHDEKISFVTQRVNSAIF